MTKADDTLIPVFDYQQKRRVGYKAIKSASSGVVGQDKCSLIFEGNPWILLCSFFFLSFQVIVDGTYALHAKLRSLLDIRVAVVLISFFLLMFLGHVHH